MTQGPKNAQYMLRAPPLHKPKLEWLTSDDTPVEVDRVRVLLANGSLLLPPFAAEQYRRDVHGAVYRCRLNFDDGHALLSRSIHVHGMVDVPWEVVVRDEYVMAGNAAILRCAVPARLADRVDRTAWLTRDHVDILEYKHLPALNVLTLKNDENLIELTYALKQIKWDIVGISEVRRMGESWRRPLPTGKRTYRKRDTSLVRERYTRMLAAYARARAPPVRFSS
ncbi:Down syndrome cell adhesion molecule-like protein Dscam2 [Eumeta japonica]|uniref:Down syndrome cell adhesion molecule-like protein Dscam2 n=1 Tax=Eumeta variegata TaxID=151549 RepID=A0A4C1X8Z3_EUMVA|nr:Down syndrome cell adhesion molecule-like protein Dscam2 [Eumeta japonica]